VEAFSDLADELWVQTRQFDTASNYLASQLCRAIDSVGANLCEGYGRGTPGQLRQFYGYAYGSGLEAEYWLDRCISRKLIETGSGIPQKLNVELVQLKWIIDQIERSKK
jgi:four helix bundle protein